MKGQYTICDCMAAEKKRPCDYRFKRYIGQKVILDGEDGIFEIVEIYPYYTYVKQRGKGILAGTPTTIAPADKEDYINEQL